MRRKHNEQRARLEMQARAAAAAREVLRGTVSIFQLTETLDILMKTPSTLRHQLAKQNPHLSAHAL